ncbi:class I SAM-dependent DNA methyltransferase [Rothia mucilaginosa]|uniref:DNA methyltransferase n=1 Tax=Rothia mucilaginosa TaxID=43675 RepID=UPI001C55F89C|nr:DNA methyltransferase [Rothia mucilaginosa]QXW98441.1 class I SAM-dependent DNA methyltransferase [Rothia mucilaginosa]
MAVVWPDDDLDQARSYLVEGRLGDFFRESLGWDDSDLGDSSFQTVKVDDPLVPSGVLNVECVAVQSGIPVWVCRVDRIPSNTSQLEVDRTLRALSMHRLCIFVQEGVGFTPRQVWRWPSASSSRLTRHELLVTDEAQVEALLERCALLYLTSDDIANGVSILGLLDRMRRGFDVETVNETRVASNQMAGLFESLAKAGMSEAQISTVMARLLFLLFADDTQMWSESEDANSFERMIRGTHQEGTDLAQRLNELFGLLNKKPSGTSAVADAPDYLSGFKYVNGGMFADAVPLPAEMSGAVAKTFRQQLLATSERDWSKVSPAIFGSMFQSVRDAKTRREMGEHYTSEEDVLKTLGPLFLDELRDKFTGAEEKSDEVTRLRNLRRELANIRFIDPACGCGNFIIIAYREMRKLELDVLVRLRNLGQIDESELSSLVVGKAGVSEDVRKRARSIEPLVTIDNFYGLELDPWPASIARTAMFLVERQMDQKMMEDFGYAPVRLPLSHSAHILEGDALTEVNPASGERVDRDWSKVLPVTAQDVADGVRVYIAGNPPFVGQAKKGDAQDQGMRLAWGDDYAGYLDFATAWLAKAARYLKTLQEQTEALDVKVVPGDFAFVSTNSIVQGQPVASLFAPLFRDGWRIKFAYRTFPWVSEAAGKAAVHCVITGFTRSAAPEKSRTVRVFDYDWSTRRTVEQEPVHALNAYLVEGPNVLAEKRSKPLSSLIPEVVRGSQPTDGGNLIVEVEDYPVVAADPVAVRYLRPFVGAKELVQGLERWCLWLEDASEEEIASSPVLSARVEANREWRSAQPQKGDAYKLRDIPHLMRPNKARPVEPYVCIPSVVSANRPIFTVKRFSADTIASNATFTALDPDGFLFGLISSSMFIIWQRTVGGQLKSDLRFSNTVVWNNLPLPQISEEQRRKVIAAGRKVLAAREAIEERAGEPVSLADMYASLATMDPALRAAHDELDSAVDVAFGATRRCSSDEARLKILFERYQELTAAEEAAKPAKKPRARRRTAK